MQAKVWGEQFLGGELRVLGCRPMVMCEETEAGSGLFTSISIKNTEAGVRGD